MFVVRVYLVTVETEENVIAFYTYIEDGITKQCSPYLCELLGGSKN
jgi:hypothetical protein